MNIKDELVLYSPSKFDEVKTYYQKKDKTIISISKFILNENDIIEYEGCETVIDISALINVMHQYHSERILSLFDESFTFIADEKHESYYKEELRFCFIDFNIFKEYSVLNEISENDDSDNTALNKHRKIIDLSPEELCIFFSSFNKLLYGHEKFKNDFKALIENFIVFNKMGDHKILSFFLMGDSGVGKTEVARAIHRSLNGQKKLAKINFGNYSSDNSLNSLIGSPRGYIGSEDGEIFIRVAESDVGVILIDEFEKSNSTLFNYFLDVLEDGKMVSSMANEIDLNGFIIIFTSNIGKENFKNVISPELRSRFDYKGYFSELQHEEKFKFVDFRIDNIMRRYNEQNKKILGSNFKYEVINSIDVSKHKNMRDLNKLVKKVFLDKLKNK